MAMMLPQVVNAVTVTESDVNVMTPDGTADCYFVHPATGTAPGVLVWPDIFGLRPAFRQMGKRLAESGYAVLVVNPFYRVKKAPTADKGSATPIPQLLPLAQALTETTQMTDAKAFIGWLDQQASVAKNRKVGTQGYCMGGPIAFRTAAAVPDRVGAVASFHGGGLVTDMPNSPHLQAAKTKAQLLIAIAANDDMQTPDREGRAEGDVRQGEAARGNRSVHGRGARLVPSGFGGLQRATGRKGLEPVDRALREGAGLNTKSSHGFRLVSRVDHQPEVVAVV